MTWSLGGGGTITQLREIVEETWNQSKVKTMKRKKIIFLVGFKIFCPCFYISYLGLSVLLISRWTPFVSDFNLGIFSGYIYFSLVQQMKILRLKIRVDAFILLSIVNLFKCDFLSAAAKKERIVNNQKLWKLLQVCVIVCVFVFIV